MAHSLAPLPGFDWSLVTWVGPDEPLIGADVAHELCSYCGDAIPEDSVPLRAFHERQRGEVWGAVFCDHCVTTWWGMRTYDELEPRHEPEVRAKKGRAGE